MQSMKKSILLISLVFVSILITCSNEKKGILDGIEESYYDSGRLKSEITVKKGIYNGSAKYYYETGKLLNICKYQDGIKVGTSTVFYESGQKMVVENMNELGELNGLRESYYENRNRKTKQ